MKPKLRTAKFNRGDQEIEHPVDILGRAVSFTTLDANPITRDASGNDSAPIGFKGVAIAYNQRTWIGSKTYGYWEQIAPEALTKTITEADVRFLINHDPNLLLGRNRAGNLRLDSASDGLNVDADMTPTTYARDLALSLEARDISQMSFAFTPIAWRTEEAADGKELITFTELRLWDVSVVTYPAYDMTTAGLRDEAFEALCRTAGLTPDDVLRDFASGEPLTIATPAPAESTRSEREEPPPAESTERDQLNPGDRLRDLRADQLARTFR